MRITYSIIYLILVFSLTGHAFSLREIEVDGAPYFKMIPYWGRRFTA